MRPIKLQIMPSDGICMLYAAAMCLHMRAGDLAELIGHDGREVVWPGARGCQRMRGIQLDEINDMLRPEREIFATIVLNVQSVNGMADCVPFIVYKDLSNRLDDVIKGCRGILTGYTASGLKHAVAVDYDGAIYNPGSAELESVITFHPLAKLI